MFRDAVNAQRYELTAPDGVTFADYRDAGSVRIILHVETPAAARGKGYAGQLMDAIVQDARQRGLKLQPSCSYAAAYMERHPEATDVRA